MLIVYEISVQVVFMFSGSKCKEKLLASFFFSLYEYPNLQKGTTIDFFNCNYYNYSTRRYPYEKIAWFMAIACMMFILPGCANETAMNEHEEGVQENSSAYHKIDAKEAKSMMDKEKVTIVDVRTEQEYKEKHIPNSILVPNETIDEEAKDKLPDKDAVLLVHCRTGIRSKQASDKLVQMGYKHVYDFGGINDWPYDTVSE